MIDINDFENRNAEKIKAEAKSSLLMMETVMTLDAVTRLLVSKGIISQAEVEGKKTELLTSPEYEYSAVYETCQNLLKTAQLIEDDPLAFIQKLCEARAKGVIQA